jgi:hypothetical protein
LSSVEQVNVNFGFHGVVILNSPRVEVELRVASEDIAKWIEQFIKTEVADRLSKQ